MAGDPVPEAADDLLRSLYVAFNARDTDAVLAAVTEDVDWPNAWEGGRLQGKAAVRDYWERQWAEIDPRVDPISVTSLDDGRIVVEVSQVVRSLDGEVIGEGRVEHIYELRDGLVARMVVSEG
ncbi:MAG: nuclear transport factor 2 family protein [Solirubrobacteraceae bacterium]